MEARRSFDCSLTSHADPPARSSEIAHASSYGAHRVYDPRKSSTAKHASSTWKISYGDGSSASGHVYLDSVTVAGVSIPDQAVEVAHEISKAFLKDGGNDGLLGLAWPSINTVQPHRVATPVQNMIKQRLIDPVSAFRDSQQCTLVDVVVCSLCSLRSWATAPSLASTRLVRLLIDTRSNDATRSMQAISTPPSRTTTSIIPT